MSEADGDRAYFYAEQSGEGPPLDLLATLRASINPPSQVKVETAKVRALAALTRATEAMNVATRLAEKRNA